MPVVLRSQRLNCHYCGQRSKETASTRRGGRFHCEHCLAVNFFDENGEIADVPVDEVAPETRWAQPANHRSLAPDSVEQDSIFCPVCLKNQHIYNYTLSHYLPDPSHPDYDRLEEELPEYKKGLEQRYPQCCANCEPRVRAQLQQATYNARSDHLRRVLEKSRQWRIDNRWGWRSILVNAAGLGYAVSVTVQVLWHAYGSQITQITFVEVPTPLDCLRIRSLSSPCLDATEPLVALSLVLGLICIWWNPKWHHKLVNREGRLVGLHEYYLAQFVLIGLRFSAWIALLQVPLSTRTKAMLHACSAVALSVFAMWSVLSIVSVKVPPPVNWHQDPAPMLTGRPFVPSTELEIKEQPGPQYQPFNVNGLAGPSRSTNPSWQPPTPPLNGDEAMDWTPSTPAFRPQPRQTRYLALGPTPFHGTLPAVNAQGVHRNPTQTQRGREAIGLPPGFFDKPASTALPPRQFPAASESMAQPTFFGLNEGLDTGLESIFDTVFSIQDQSSGEGLAPTRRSTKPISDSSKRTTALGPAANSIARLFSSMSIFFVLICLATLIFEAALTSKMSDLGYWLVLTSTMIPIGHIVIALRDDSKGRIPGLLLYTLEVGALIGIAMLYGSMDVLLQQLWNKLAIGVIGMLVPQEYVALNRSFVPAAREQQTSHWDSGRPGVSPGAGDGLSGRQPVVTDIPRSVIPGLLQQDSNDSPVSDMSDAAMTDFNPWETPRTHNGRFEYFENAHPVPSTTPLARAQNFNTSGSRPRTQQPSHWASSASLSGDRGPTTRSSYGLEALGLGDNSGISGNRSAGISDIFDRNLNLEGNGSNTGPRAARRRPRV